jgi:hypothetical protein
MELTDEIILSEGYKEYKPTKFHNQGVVKCFQKRFDDEAGKKYFIDVNKWYWRDIVPAHRRDSWYKEYTYEFETQVYGIKDHDAIDLTFHSSWELEDVEEFVEKIFQTGMLDYYEKWND